MRDLRSKSSQEPQLSQFTQLGYRSKSERLEWPSEQYIPTRSFSWVLRFGAEKGTLQLHSTSLSWVLGWKPVTWRWSWISWSWFVLSWEEGGFDFGKDWMGILGFPYIDRVSYSSEGSESNVAVRFKRKRNKVRVFGNRVRWKKAFL